MSESKIQPSVALVLGSVKIIQPLRLSHSIPFLVARLITEDIVNLDQDIKDKIHDKNSKQLPITTVVFRSVILAIDVGSNNTASLTKHVVTGGRYGSRAYAIRVA